MAASATKLATNVPIAMPGPATRLAAEEGLATGLTAAATGPTTTAGPAAMPAVVELRPAGLRLATASVAVT